VIDISPGHLEIVKSILAEIVPDDKVYVFGSRAASGGTLKKHSDLDLAIKGIGIVGKKIMRRLATAFEESDLPFRVDIVDLNATKENFRAIIEKQAVPINEQRPCDTRR
jgi:predicted nucleotidyltransferase